MSGIRKILITMGLAVLLISPCSQSLADSRPFYERWVDGIASEVYSVAWPTASYRSVYFSGSRKNTDGSTDVAFRLVGRSGFDNSVLWTDVVLNIRDRSIQDISWGNNNALIAKPGATMALMGQLALELSRDLQRSSASNNGYGFVINNKCKHPLKVAIHYTDLNGKEHSEGWWDITGNSETRLADSHSVSLLTNTAEWYYYAESTDYSNLTWEGVYSFTVNGKPVKMKRLEDKKGDSDITLTCF